MDDEQEQEFERHVEWLPVPPIVLGILGTFAGMLAVALIVRILRSF